MEWLFHYQNEIIEHFLGDNMNIGPFKINIGQDNNWTILLEDRPYFTGEATDRVEAKKLAIKKIREYLKKWYDASDMKNEIERCTLNCAVAAIQWKPGIEVACVTFNPYLGWMYGSQVIREGDWILLDLQTVISDALFRQYFHVH